MRTVWESEYEPAQASYRLVGRLLNIFGLIAVMLSALGTYSVISFTWAQRARELGVRVAFGAAARDVFALVLGGGQRLALIGILIGSALALIAFRVASGLFFGVSAWDPLTYVGVAAILLATATVASLSPALRAVKTDPVEVLRLE